MDKSAMEGSSRSGRKTSFLAAIISSVVTTLVLGTIVVALYYGTSACSSHRQTTTPAQNIFVEVSTDRQQNNLEIRKKDEIIVSRSANKHADMDQSLVIQDYKRGLQAIKDLSKDKCYVFPTSTDFLTAEKILGERKDQPARSDVPIYINKTASSEPIPDQMMSAAVGQHIAELCSGIDTFWLMDTPGADTHRMKRKLQDIVIITDDGVIVIEDERDIVIDTRNG